MTECLYGFVRFAFDFGPNLRVRPSLSKHVTLIEEQSETEIMKMGMNWTILFNSAKVEVISHVKKSFEHLRSILGVVSAHSETGNH